MAEQKQQFLNYDECLLYLSKREIPSITDDPRFHHIAHPDVVIFEHHTIKLWGGRQTGVTSFIMEELERDENAVMVSCLSHNTKYNKKKYPHLKDRIHLVTRETTDYSFLKGKIKIFVDHAEFFYQMDMIKKLRTFVFCNADPKCLVIEM